MLELSFGLRPVFLDSPKEVRLFTRCKKRCFLLSKLNFARWQSKSRIRPKKTALFDKYANQCLEWPPLVNSSGKTSNYVRTVNKEKCIAHLLSMFTFSEQCNSVIFDTILYSNVRKCLGHFHGQNFWRKEHVDTFYNIIWDSFWKRNCL